MAVFPSIAKFPRLATRLDLSLRLILGLLLLLACIRIALPYVGLHLINKALSEKLGAYHGQIEDFDLTLYRGAYQLQGLVIKKRQTDLPPLLSIKEIDLSLAWRALLRGKLLADLHLDEPTLRLLDSEKATERQFGREESASNWRAAFDVIVPMQIASLAAEGGRVHFLSRSAGEPRPVDIDQITVSVLDLRSRDRHALSPVKLKGRLQSHAELKVEGRLNPLAESRRADLNFELKGFRMDTVNDALRTYVPIDITRGLLSLYGEVILQESDAEGYAKIFLHDGDVIAPRQKFFSIKHFFLEIAGALGNWLLQNNKTKNLAFVLPFSYKSGALDVNASDAFWSAVKNQGEALPPGVEHKISLPE